MTNKPNFEGWDADEMRATRREWINYFIHKNYFAGHPNLASVIKSDVRNMELFKSGFELKRYYYYEYK